MADRKALVTGGSRGIGLAIAKGFATSGMQVILAARDERELGEAKKEIPSAQTVVLDVTDIARVEKALQSIAGLDVLVNAAGVIEPIGPIEQADPTAWRRLLEINVFGTFLMTHCAIPLFKEGGAIINFVGGGEGAFPNFSAYAASKGAIARFTETVAAELRGRNITVNAIAPGAVNTKMTQDMLAAGEKAGAQYQRALEQEKNPDATPEKAVRLALWLASPQARSITGKVLSAQWDDYEDFPAHAEDIVTSDVYTMRRVRPKDRGFTWER